MARKAVGEPRAPKADRLFQEDLLREPFWMLVACSLVNLTTWTKAEPVLRYLRTRYVVPEVLAVAREEDLYGALLELGLWRRRAKSLVRLARAFVAHPPRTADDVLALPGCGRYASDSWAIFFDRRLDVKASDGKLLWYLMHQRSKQLGRPVRTRREVLP